MLTIMDEYSRECLAIQVARRLKSQNVLDTLYFCSVNVVCRITYVQTTALSSQLKPFGSGLKRSE